MKNLFNGDIDDLADIEAVAPVSQKASGVDPSHHFGCPLWWFTAVYPIVHNKAELAVAIYLWRRRKVTGNHKTFSVPNGELKSWGIPRKAKYRALNQLVAAGLITVGRRGKRALTVTISPQPKGTRQ